MKVFNYLFKENPVFVLTLGLCSTLAVSTTFEKSYMMGLTVLIVLLISNTVISLIRKFVTDEIRIPVYIIIISTIVTILEIVLSKYNHKLYEAFGIYLPLIIVNCIILGRALSYASKNNVKDSFMDGLKTGLGYLAAISIIGFIRELLGNGTLTFMDNISSITGYRSIVHIFDNDIIPNKLFLTNGGAFILLGLIIALVTFIRRKHESN